MDLTAGSDCRLQECAAAPSMGLQRRHLRRGCCYECGARGSPDWTTVFCASSRGAGRALSGRPFKPRLTHAPPTHHQRPPKYPTHLPPPTPHHPPTYPPSATLQHPTHPPPLTHLPTISDPYKTPKISSTHLGQAAVVHGTAALLKTAHCQHVAVWRRRSVDLRFHRHRDDRAASHWSLQSASMAWRQLRLQVRVRVRCDDTCIDMIGIDMCDSRPPLFHPYLWIL